MTQEELEQAYKKWNYTYKPSLGFFMDMIHPAYRFLDHDYFIEKLTETIAKAYFCPVHAIAHHGFNELACLIYFAMVTGIKTPYDHILKSDKDFEWKLNNLH